MPFEYKDLDEDDKNRIRGRVVEPDPEPEFTNFLPAWEAEHFAHTVLLEQAVTDGDEDAQETHREAIATLEASITNVRAGKRPDGTDRVIPPAPPAPTPPAPTDPAAPTDPNAPVQGDEPTPPAPRRASAKKKDE